ncbi:YihY/virulence factor BrkB family protein [Georgenia sp. MJ170]|uniref:YihY/virulence factor BrkB family protein n=1 Tax=Georgenia sunbinii TaxID=3117728 RepID=UPI002F26CF72
MATVAPQQDDSPGIAQRLQALLEWWNHSRVGRGLARYGNARGGLLAGGITYSALFSIFAALAIGYTAFMAVLGGNDELRTSVIESVNGALPGILQTADSPDGLVDPDSLVLDTALNPTTVIAVGVLLWTAITVMDALKRSIRAMFGITVPRENFAKAKARNLGGFLVLALAVVLTAALGIAAGTAGGWFMSLIGIDGALAALALRILGFAVALAVDAAVFVLLFRVLAGVHAPRRDLLIGALVGGAAAGVLRILGTSVVGGADDPVLAAGAALVTLLLWINLLARVTLMVAAWTANPPAPPKPKDPAATRFDEDPNFVTLSVPETLAWDYEAITGTVQTTEDVREEVLAGDLERLGDDGEDALARRRAEIEEREWAERVAEDQRRKDAYWGGLYGAVRRRVNAWRRRRMEGRFARYDADLAQAQQRRRARGEQPAPADDTTG